MDAREVAKADSLESEVVDQSLFREHAVLSASERYGSPISSFGVGMWVLTGSVSLLLIVTAYFLFTTAFPRRATVAGALVPEQGLLSIVSPRDGAITGVFVKEGDDVKVGDPLLTISSESGLKSGGNVTDLLAQTAIEQSELAAEKGKATAESIASQEDGVRSAIKAKNLQLSSLDNTLRNYRTQEKISADTVHDISRLRSERLVSELQYRDAQLALLSAQQNVAEIERQISNAASERDQLRESLARLSSDGVVAAKAARSEALAAQEKLLNARGLGDLTLVARTAGQVTSLQARRGGAVRAGTTVGALMPDHTELLAELWVPSSSIGFVNIGTSVGLMYDGFPYQKFGVARGSVLQIAQSPTEVSSLPLDIQAKESHYRILVKLDHQVVAAYGKKLALGPGMRLKADLALERRSLIEWIFEPLLAAKKRQQ